MMKACFDCDNDVILTDVIHEKRDIVITYTLDRVTYHSYFVGTYVVKIVEYTCRMCGTKWYVTVGYDFIKGNDNVICQNF